MRLNPQIFIGFEVDKYPQEFVDKMENIIRVMYVSNTEEVEFPAY